MTRIELEQHIVERMIRLYCRRKEGNKELCSGCDELLRYATLRLSKCPFGEHKTSCRRCTVHCYRPDMKTRIKQVMRFSGPRMIIYHPIIALKHMLD